MTIDTYEEEIALIGAICREPKLIRTVARIVEPEHFSFGGCRTVYEYALDTEAQGHVFDVLIAADALKDKIPEIRNFLAECMDITPTTANTEEYAKLLREKAEERTLREKIGFALDDLRGEKLTEAIASVCAEQIQHRSGGRMKKFSEVMQKAHEGLYTVPKNRVDTGYGKLDAMLMGMWGEELIILAARPAVGKSAMALSIAENAARKGKTVQLYSLEMSDTSIGERELARWTERVTMSDIIRRGFGNDEAKNTDVAQAFVKTAELPIYLDDSPNVKPSRVRAQALAQRDLGLIVIDYGGLMAADKKAESRNLELGAISRDLKNLAKELEIPVVMLAQLSRKVGGDDIKPRLIDLRDSGELEQNADKCIFLWNIDKENGKVGVSVAKNRRGKLGEVVMYFDGEHMRFSETEERYEEPKRKRRGNRESVYDDDLPMD